MALIECEECGGKVSTSAAACPHCGFRKQAAWQVDPVRANQPDESRPRYRANFSCGTVALVLLLLPCLLVAVVNVFGDDEPAPVAEESPSYPSTQFHIIANTEIGVRGQKREAIRIRVEAEGASRADLEEIGSYAWSKAEGELDELVLWFYMPGQDEEGPACVTAEYGPEGLKSYSRLDSVCS